MKREEPTQRKAPPRPIDLLDPEKVITHRATAVACGSEKTLTPIGFTDVQNPAQLTPAESRALLDSWNARALEMMATWCRIAAPEGCDTVVPLRVSFPPRESVRINPNGPPHRYLIEMDITFRCEESV